MNAKEVDTTEVELRDTNVHVKGYPEVLHVDLGDDGARDIDLCNHCIGRKQWHEGANVARTHMILAKVQHF